MLYDAIRVFFRSLRDGWVTARFLFARAGGADNEQKTSPPCTVSRDLEQAEVLTNKLSEDIVRDLDYITAEPCTASWFSAFRSHFQMILGW